jgi:integrase
MKYNLSDIPFAALNKSFIEKYDLYLRIECGHAPGTIVVQTTNLGTVVGKAIGDGIITANPFAGYEPERPQRKQRYLTREELDRLMTTPLNKSRHYLARDLFLFSCYTGIPFGDMCKLTDEDIEITKDGAVWIKTKRKKTGIDYELPLLELPLQILDRYREFAPEGRLLPMPSNDTLNRHLKELAAVCSIDREISFHTVRHTYASEITLSQGVPIETVSRMLGHGKIKTTQIYAKITDDKIDEDMKALDKRLAGQFQFAI